MLGSPGSTAGPTFPLRPPWMSKGATFTAWIWNTSLHSPGSTPPPANKSKHSWRVMPRPAEGMTITAIDRQRTIIFLILNDLFFMDDLLSQMKLKPVSLTVRAQDLD